MHRRLAAGQDHDRLRWRHLLAQLLQAAAHAVQVVGRRLGIDNDRSAGKCRPQRQPGNSNERSVKAISQPERKLDALLAIALFSSWVVLASAAPKVIDIEPEECQTRCYWMLGIPVYCYEICF